MQSAPPHPRERDRLRSLHALEVLDTDDDERFDRLTDLVATVLGVPIALVSLIDEHRQWFKSCRGLDARETDRDLAFCAHAIVDDDIGTPFVVPDARRDVRFADNPLVTGEPHIRFYAGQVLHDPSGLPLGTLCAIDLQPRELDGNQLRSLVQIAEIVEHELQRSLAERRSIDVASSEQMKASILGAVTEGMVLQAADGTLLDWNPAAERLLGIAGERGGTIVATDPRFAAVREDGTPFPESERPSKVALRTGERVEHVIGGLDRPGHPRIWLDLSAQPIVDDDGVVRIVSTFTDVTAEVSERRERRRLEDDLRRQSDLVRAALNALEQGVIVMGPVGGIRLANAAARSILGYDTSELRDLWRSGRWQSYDGDGEPMALEQRPIVRALTSGEPVVGEIVQWRSRSGELVLLRVSCIPGVDDDGSMVIAFTDITDDEIARRLLDTTLEMAPAGLAILDRDGIVTRCNPAFAEQAGRPADEIVGMNSLELLDPLDRDEGASERRRLETGSTERAGLDHRVARPDGEERWVHTQVAVVPMGERPMAVASTFDVTERRALLRDLTRYSYLFEHSNDLISVLGRDGQLLYASPATGRLLGHPDGYRHPDGIFGMLHPDDVDGAADAFVSVVESDDLVEPFTARVRALDGSYFHVEFSAVNLLDEPAVAGVLVTGRDVTQRVRLTEQLAHRAGHDTLTSIPNRRIMRDEIRLRLGEFAETGTGFGVCFIDLDGFKTINDRFGHAAGDEVLCAVAACLQANAEPRDLVARVGGDEFVVVLPDVAGDAVTRRVTRLRDALIELASSDPGLAGLGASIGVAVVRRGDDSSSLLSRADAAMYRAKEARDWSIEHDDGLANPVERSDRDTLTVPTYDTDLAATQQSANRRAPSPEHARVR